MTNGGASKTLFLAICLFLVYGMFVVRKFEGYDFARYDPGWMVTTVMSIVEDGDLDLRNQLHNDPSQAADQTSRGAGGEWYPLHEFLMPLLTVPFYLTLGIYGCLVFNVVILSLLMVGVFYLCRRLVDDLTAFSATVLTAFPSLFVDYSYSYSLDVFGAFLLVTAYWFVLRNRALTAGLVFGFAVLGRLSNAVAIVGIVPFLLLTQRCKDNPISSKGSARAWLHRFRSPALFLLAGVPAATVFWISNWLMFGSPTVTSYDQWQHFVDGLPVIRSQNGAFGCSLIEQLPAVLFDKESGLFVGAPLVMLAFAFGIRSYWLQHRNEAILWILTSTAYIVLFSKYCYSYPGIPGNRYLMPVVALSALPLAKAIRNFFAVRSPGAG